MSTSRGEERKKKCVACKNKAARCRHNKKINKSGSKLISWCLVNVKAKAWLRLSLYQQFFSICFFFLIFLLKSFHFLLEHAAFIFLSSRFSVCVCWCSVHFITFKGMLRQNVAK